MTISVSEETPVKVRTRQVSGLEFDVVLSIESIDKYDNNIARQ